ncbi:MAG TPA: hypothetical protein VF230_18245 [Acidimicrobiales bacterium]
MVAIAAAVIVAPQPASAEDDYDTVECTWGADEGQPRGYAWDFEGGHDAARPEVAAAHRRATTDVNEIMGGRVVIRYNANATWGLYEAATRIRVKIANYGNNGKAGWWNPWGNCWSIDGGTYHYTYGDIVYNTYYSDKNGGRDPNYVPQPGVLPSLTMHETFHSIGGDHLALNTSNPPSRCNLSYDSAEPFGLGGDCEAMAGYAKPGDVGELQRHYPLPKPPSASCRRSFDLCGIPIEL